MSEVKYSVLAVNDIAVICHQANKAYCESIGDYSQVDWDLAPEWQRLPVISGVKSILESDCPTVRASHDDWVSVKKEQGWKYGPVKDADKKEHPCIVDYEDLPEKDRLKDVLFLSIVKVFKV